MFPNHLHGLFKDFANFTANGFAVGFRTNPPLGENTQKPTHRFGGIGRSWGGGQGKGPLADQAAKSPGSASRGSFALAAALAAAPAAVNVLVVIVFLQTFYYGNGFLSGYAFLRKLRRGNASKRAV